MANSSGADSNALLERNRDLEAQLQAQHQEAAEREQRLNRPSYGGLELKAQRQEAAEREQRLKQQAAQLVQQMERHVAEAKEEARQLAQQLDRCEESREVAHQALASTREELRSLHRRMRYYEHDEGEQLLLFVARRQLGSWDAKTQRRVLLATKAAYAELLPLVTRAVLTMNRPCSFAGAIGLRELTLNLDDRQSVATRVQADMARWSHLTALRVLTLSTCATHGFEFPASISNLASLSAMRIGRMSPTGLHHLSALRQLASLKFIHCEPELEALPVLPSLQALHVEGYYPPGMQHLARQTNLTKLHMVGRHSSSIQHFEHLAMLTGLQDLVLCYCLGDIIVNLEPLTPLTRLTQLCLPGACVTSLQPLTTLAQLRVLDLVGVLGLEGLGPLTYLSALEHLDIRCCGTARVRLDVASLTALSGLKTVNITGSMLQNLEMLSGMQQLTVIGQSIL